jgi:hypothetical protein
MRALGVVLLAGLAGCEAERPASEPEPGPAVEAATASPPSRLAGPPPPRYVGRWAASADMCTTGWWRFWADELRTGMGEMRCDILPPDAQMGDERRRAVCVGEGQVVREEWVMTYPAEGLMTISRNGAPVVTLGRCT